eukprot:m.183983 g.183983  ORF g.183983 m.183983 type:complete len:112 (-) comp13594_c0_seq1:1087-1422(-)
MDLYLKWMMILFYSFEIPPRRLRRCLLVLEMLLIFQRFSTFSDKCHTIWKEKESQQSVTCETNTRNAKSGNKIVSSSHGSLETECVFDAKTIYNTQIPAMGSLLLQGVRLN